MELEQARHKPCKAWVRRRAGDRFGADDPERRVDLPVTLFAHRRLLSSARNPESLAEDVLATAAFEVAGSASRHKVVLPASNRGVLDPSP